MIRLLIAALVIIASGAAHAATPNFIIILADDLGYGDLACFGPPSHHTPNLDRMAAEGIRFTNFDTPYPACAPTRASLLTGRYPFRHGVPQNPAPDAGPVADAAGLPASEITLAQLLKPAGYATSCIGKWHLGHHEQFYPRRFGFDEYFGILYSNDMRPVRIMENESVAEYPVVQGTLTGKYTQRALRFLDRHQHQPFFLYLAHAMPHKPLAVSEEFYTQIHEKGRRDPVQLYADVIRELDWSVGQVLDKLRELKLDGNTIVIFTSDNGPWFGGSTGNFRGMKGKTWQGGTHIPMIAWSPRRIPAGQVTDELATIMDFFPSFAKLAGVEAPGDRTIDGRDIMPLLAQPRAKSPHQAIVTWNGNALSAVRSGDWKLHVKSPGPPRMGSGQTEKEIAEWIDPRGPDGLTIIAPWEQARPSHYPGVLTGDGPRDMMLFNITTDPAEQHDVAADHPDIVAKLKAIYDQYDQQVPAALKAAPRRPLKKD
jgi:uncharacterized sulfatase